VSRQVVLTTADGVELEYTLAGLGSRGVAVLIDSIIQMVLGLLMVIGLLLLGVSLDPLAGGWAMAAIILGGFAVFNGYFLFFEVVWNGQTPGKRNAGIRVIRADGFPLDFRGALLRNLMRTVDVLPSFYGVALLVVFFDANNRRLGDMVAGTLVVRERELDADGPEGSGSAWQAAPLASDTPLPLHLLEADHLALAETFLRRRSQLPSDVRTVMAKDAADRLRAQMRLSPQEALVGFDETLLETVVRQRARRAGL